MPDVFDEVSYKNPDVFDEIDFDQKKIERSAPSRARSIASAYPKGFIEEAGSQVRKTLSVFPEIFGLDKKLQGTLKTEPQAQEELERLLPTEQGGLEKALERAGRMTPYTAIGPEGILAKGVRTGLGALLGQGAEEAGLPPWAQGIAETIPFGLPKFGKKIIPSETQKPLVEGARELGMTEKEIAPLIHEPKETKILPKIAGKKFRTQKALEKSKNVLDEAANKLESHPSMDVVLSPREAEISIQNIEKKMMDKLNSSERKLIKDDFQILKSSPKALKDYYKFFRDVNKTIKDNPGKRDSLNLIKENIEDAIHLISPEFGRVFDLTNKLYSNYYSIANKLTPNWKTAITSYVAKGAGAAILGPLFGYVPSLVAIGGEIAAKNLAREMLINPRFQNQSKQIVQSLNQNKIGIASQLWKRLSKEVEETSPEIAEKMEEVDWESLQSDIKGNQGQN